MQKMIYSGSEFDRLHTQWPDDVTNIRSLLSEKGVFVSKATAIKCWMAHSRDAHQMGWHIPYRLNDVSAITKYLRVSDEPIDPESDEQMPSPPAYPLAFSMKHQGLVARENAEEEPKPVLKTTEPVVEPIVEPVAPEATTESIDTRAKPTRPQATGYYASREKLEEAIVGFREMPVKDIARKVGVGTATVYAILKAYRENEKSA